MTIYDMIIAVMTLGFATIASKSIIYNFKEASNLKRSRRVVDQTNMGTIAMQNTHSAKSIKQSRIDIQKYKLKLISDEIEKINTETEFPLITKIDGYLDLIIADFAKEGKIKFDNKL